MSRSTATIRDVAALAGVSHQTVSRVINGSERVSPETRQKVEQAIAALGYSPNAIARFMAHGRTRTFACCAPNLTDDTFACIIEAAENEARQAGYFVLATSAPTADAFGELVDQLIASRYAEGLIVINPYADERHRYLPPGIPTVLIGARPRPGQVDSIYLDEDEGGRCAVEHLLQLGHTRILHITGPHNEDCSLDRLNGYHKAMHAAGIDVPPEWVIEGDWSATCGYQAVQSWQVLGLSYTAIFAQNDRMAAGAIRALRDLGRRVPEDVSVVGFDDMPLASYFDPPLTSMRQDIHFNGRQAARLLIRRLENPQAPPQYLFHPAELVVRCSTARLKGGEVEKICNDPYPSSVSDSVQSNYLFNQKEK
jgi:DNA-binding LacI/PurR family transcriptional regulator